MESLAMARMARRVHLLPVVMLIVVAAALLTGCPPPPLSLDEPDAAPNSPPAILSVRGDDAKEFPLGENIPLIIGEGSMTLTLYDTDVEDTLYVRGFLRYRESDATTARVRCQAGPADPRSETRTVSCVLAGVCLMADLDIPDLPFDIDVFDREPVEDGTGTPRYRWVMEPGLKTSRSYLVTCQELPI